MSDLRLADLSVPQIGALLAASSGPLRQARGGGHWYLSDGRIRVTAHTFESMRRAGLLDERQTGGGRNRTIGALTPAGRDLAETALAVSAAIRIGLTERQPNQPTDCRPNTESIAELEYA